MHAVEFNSNQSKEAIYQEILPQIRALIQADNDLFIGTLGNVCAVLKQTFQWFWVGFYLVDAKQQHLNLSAFQGTLACSKIAKGRGVCGQSWAQNQTLIVPNVNEHPDHIACSSLSQSEIVLPFYNKNGEILGVLDVDSEHLAHFDEVDAVYLRQILDALTELLETPEVL